MTSRPFLLQRDALLNFDGQIGVRDELIIERISQSQIRGRLYAFECLAYLLDNFLDGLHNPRRQL